MTKPLAKPFVFRGDAEAFAAQFDLPEDERKAIEEALCSAYRDGLLNGHRHGKAAAA